MPFVTAFIGWMTNWLAIKMLFEPRRPLKLFFVTFHGVIPRRQEALAEECSVIIERELLHQHMIRDAVSSLDIKPLVEEKIRYLVDDKLGAELRAIPLLGQFVNDSALGKIRDIAVHEVGGMSEEVLRELADQVEDRFRVKEIVREKILAFDLDKLEEIVMHVAKKEFKTIEWVGAVLGFVIGIVQLVILMLTSGG